MIYENNKVISDRKYICTICPQMIKSKVFTDIYTCGKFMQPVSGVSCGCIVIGGFLPKTELKGQSCPQNKW